jgi:aspartate racemase
MRLRRLSRQLHAQAAVSPVGAVAPAAVTRVGIVGGLGVGAGLHYYRELAVARGDMPLELAMVHTQISTVLGLVDAGDKNGLAEYLSSAIGDLKAAGATFAVVPAVTPHYCAEELKRISPLPLVDMLECIRDEAVSRQLGRVALFGTRAVQESACYGKLDGVAEVVIPPADEVKVIGDTYNEIARSINATPEERDAQRTRLVAQAQTLIERDGVEAILLAGTDLSLVFNSDNTPFPHIDCAAVHIAAVLRLLA